MSSSWRTLSNFLLLASAVPCPSGFIFAQDIIKRYDHKGGTVVKTEVFISDLNTMQHLAESGFRADEECAHDLCVAPVHLAAQHEKNRKQIGVACSRLSYIGVLPRIAIVADPGCYDSALTVYRTRHSSCLPRFKDSVDAEIRRLHEEEVQAEARRAEAEARRVEAEARRAQAEQQQKEAETRRAEAEARRANAEARRQEAVRRQREAEEARRAAERSSFGFRALGDPILCAYNKSSGDVIEKSCVNYTGPAVVTCYDDEGLQRIIWVGVSDEDGSNRQGEDAFWVAETVAWTISTGEWSYRDDTGKHVADVSCDVGHENGATIKKSPPLDFLKSFQNSKTFLVHTMQPRIIPGPKYSFLQDMLSDGKLSELAYDAANAKPWLNAFLMMLGYATEHNIRPKALGEISKYVVLYGVAQARAAVHV